MIIRHFQEKDIKQVLFLHRIAMEKVGAYKGDGLWDADLTDIKNCYNISTSSFLVAEQEGRIIAMGAFKPSEHYFAELKRMRVLPSMQGKGIGKMVYYALEERARKIGYKGFLLETSELQKVAQMLYRKVGFEEYDRVIIDSYICILYKKLFL